MTNLFSCEPSAIIRGNASEMLKQLQTKVDCVVTSPAYYQQRIYGTSASELGREPLVGQTGQTKESHYAVFPPALIERPSHDLPPRNHSAVT